LVCQEWRRRCARVAERLDAVVVVGRYYDPTTGQFISVDPLVDLTFEPYVYVAGDPVNDTDPAGLCCKFLSHAVGYVEHEAVEHAGQVSTVAGGAALVAYGFCWAGGTGCAVGAVLSGVSAGAASIQAAHTCSTQGVGSTACVSSATGAFLSISGGAIAGKLASPEFEALPDFKGWMFAKGFGQRLAGRSQALVGAGAWGLSFAAQQALAENGGVSRPGRQTFADQCPI
jgi:hypothetical protein